MEDTSFCKKKFNYLLIRNGASSKRNLTPWKVVYWVNCDQEGTCSFNEAETMEKQALSLDVSLKETYNSGCCMTSKKWDIKCMQLPFPLQTNQFVCDWKDKTEIIYLFAIPKNK